MKMHDYVSPRVIRRVALLPESPLLTESRRNVLYDGSVDTMGQRAEERDFTDANFFTHEWQ